MRCKFCKNQIPDGSIFCNWCGARQVKERKKKSEIKVPAPRQLPSGKWFIQLRAEKQSITESTADLCVAKAKAIRAGFLAQNTSPAKLTLSQAIDRYIESRRNVLSPSTIRGYRIIQRNHFPALMNKAINPATDWQFHVNQESKDFSPKTMRNAWRFIATILRENNIMPPRVLLPQPIQNDLPWLDYTQIAAFLAAIKDQPCELAALLALSSMRRSEICALTGNGISADFKHITVHGAKVPGEDARFVIKETNKNVSSQRVVPVLIPRLDELLRLIPRNDDYIITVSPNTLAKQINRACEKNSLPRVGLHGLRRSFVSLGYHLKMSEQEIMEIGGWSDYKTVHKHYLKLAALDKQKAENKMSMFYRKTMQNTNDFTNV